MRRPAFNEPGHAHELTFCCFRRYPFLKGERACKWLAESLDEARRKLEFAIWAYVFMPEHVHVLIHPRLPQYDIRLILKQIKEPVGRKAVKHLRDHDAKWLERIRVPHGKRVEHRFWQAGGGFDRNVLEPQTLLAMIDYIHANPVRRGLVSRPEDWKWSSAGWHERKSCLKPDVIDIGGSVLVFDGRG
jgi:putative transposase